MRSEIKKAAACGLAAGLINGAFGAGGGMILVPLLRKLKLASEHDIFANALAIMLPISAVSFFAFLFRHGVAWGVALPCCLGGMLGGLIAGIMLKRVPFRWLHLAFGVLILWCGLQKLL